MQRDWCGSSSNSHVSECRYRWLHVPATTFVITHSPSRSNRRDGFGFSRERRGRRSRSGHAQRYQVHPEMTGGCLLSTEHLEKPLRAISAKEWRMRIGTAEKIAAQYFYDESGGGSSNLLGCATVRFCTIS